MGLAALEVREGCSLSSSAIQEWAPTWLGGSVTLLCFIVVELSFSDHCFRFLETRANQVLPINNGDNNCEWVLIQGTFLLSH